MKKTFFNTKYIIIILFMMNISMNKKIVDKIIINLLNNIYSKNNIVKNVYKYPYLVRGIKKFDTQLVKKIILKVQNKKSKIKIIMEEFSRKMFYDYWADEDKESNLIQILRNSSMVELLLPIYPELMISFYQDEYYYKIMNFDFMCNLLEKCQYKNVIYLYFELNNINDIPENQFYKLVNSYSQILDEFNFYELFDRFGEDLIINCIKIDPSTILYFKQYIVLDLWQLVFHNPFIVEYIDNMYHFKRTFLNCIKYIDKNDSLFISEDTYNKYFLDACHSYYVLYAKKLSKDINRIIITYLV